MTIRRLCIYIVTAAVFMKSKVKVKAMPVHCLGPGAICSVSSLFDCSLCIVHLAKEAKASCDFVHASINSQAVHPVDPLLLRLSLCV